MFKSSGNSVAVNKSICSQDGRLNLQHGRYYDRGRIYYVSFRDTSLCIPTYVYILYRPVYGIPRDQFKEVLRNNGSKMGYGECGDL